MGQQPRTTVAMEGSQPELIRQAVCTGGKAFKGAQKTVTESQTLQCAFLLRVWLFSVTLWLCVVLSILPM